MEYAELLRFYVATEDGDDCQRMHDLIKQFAAQRQARFCDVLDRLNTDGMRLIHGETLDL